MISAHRSGRIWALMVSVLFVGACYTYSASVSLTRAGESSTFTRGDVELAVATVAEVAAPFGLVQTHHAERLATYPATEAYPYEAVLTLGAAKQHPSVSVLGEIKSDRSEMRFGVRDLEHGRSTRFTSQLVEALRSALARAFPDHRLEVTHRRELRLFSA